MVWSSRGHQITVPVHLVPALGLSKQPGPPHLGGAYWFPALLLSTGIFFTLCLKFPQIRYFRHAIAVTQGKFDKDGARGDTSHFQALATALSGTVGTGNIGGVALALHLGGPAALFWMWMTAFFGMTSKFVEVTLSHKYRSQTEDGTMAGGPMYYMEKGLKLKWLAVLFAIATVLSSFGTGNLPQINNIAAGLESTFNLDPLIAYLSSDDSTVAGFNGSLQVIDGRIQNQADITVINSRSFAENVLFSLDGEPVTGELAVSDGRLDDQSVVVTGESLVHSVPLTTEAFDRGLFGNYGQYIVSIGLMLFAFSTAIAWSYYGDRAMTYLLGPKSVLPYRVIYVCAFFYAALADTTIIWNVSLITIVLMTTPSGARWLDGIRPSR